MSEQKRRRSRTAIPSEMRRRMQSEHGDWYGFRIIVLGNLYSYEPHLQLLTELGLLPDELAVLAHLADWGDTTANIIGTMAGRPKNSISRAVIRLTRDDYVRSQVDAADRRRLILTITPSGRELYRKAMRPFRDQETRMFGFLSKSELKHLDGLLLKILTHWSDEFMSD